MKIFQEPALLSGVKRLAPEIALLVPVLWMLDVYVKDMARVLFVAVALLLLVKRGWRGVPVQPGARFTMVFSALAGVYFFFLISNEIFGVYLGTQGIDFSIFCQAVDSLGRRGALMVSLMGLEWRDFLSHHFSPILYIPSAITMISGAPAYIVTPLLHVAAIALSARAFHRISRHFGFSKPVCLLFLAAFLFNPNVMHSVKWGVHPEIMALPFIGYAYLFWLEKKDWRSALALLVSMTAKESMFLFVITFCVMTFVHARFTEREKLSWKNSAPYMAVGLLALAGFIVYFFMQPMLFGKQFDHFSKLAGISVLFNPAIIFQKVWFLVFLFLPVLGAPFWSKRSAIFLLPSAPFLGMILVSGFDEMFKPMNYYAVAPTYIIYISSLVTIRGACPDFRKTLPVGFTALLIFAIFSFAEMKPLKMTKRAVNAVWLSESQLAMIPDSAVVVVSDSAAPMMFRCKRLVRIWIANRMDVDYDYVVTTARERREVGRRLASGSVECLAPGPWVIRCAPGKSSPGN